jgi:hypothetical protein
VTATIPAQAPAPSAPAGPRPWRQAVRILRMEIRHSAFVWCLPLLVVLFIYDPYRTAASYPVLWPLRSTVVLNKFWPDMVVFAAGFSAWAGSREGRRNVGDLLATTARPAWARQLCSLAGTACWDRRRPLRGSSGSDTARLARGQLGRAQGRQDHPGAAAMTAVSGPAITHHAARPTGGPWR